MNFNDSPEAEMAKQIMYDLKLLYGPTLPSIFVVAFKMEESNSILNINGLKLRNGYIMGPTICFSLLFTCVVYSLNLYKLGLEKRKNPNSICALIDAPVDYSKFIRLNLKSKGFPILFLINFYWVISFLIS